MIERKNILKYFEFSDGTKGGGGEVDLLVGKFNLKHFQKNSQNICEYLSTTDGTV